MLSAPEATKTGRSTRPIGKAALSLLSTLPRRASEFVFPNRDGSANADLKKQIATLFDAAGLTDVLAGAKRLAERLKVQREEHEAAAGGKVSALPGTHQAIDHLQKRIREERKELMEMIHLLPPKYWFRGGLPLLGDPV